MIRLEILFWDCMGHMSGYARESGLLPVGVSLKYFLSRGPKSTLKTDDTSEISLLLMQRCRCRCQKKDEEYRMRTLVCLFNNSNDVVWVSCWAISSQTTEAWLAYLRGNPMTAYYGFMPVFTSFRTGPSCNKRFMKCWKVRTGAQHMYMHSHIPKAAITSTHMHLAVTQ